MKTLKTLTCLLVMGIVVAGCKKDSNTPPTDAEIVGSIVKPATINSYNYPVLPGTPQWAALQTYAEMLNAVKIPETTLHNLTTWELVESCFNYPLKGDYSSANCPSTWINDLAGSFDGLQELFSRADAPGILLYNYRYMDFDTNPSLTDWEYIELMVGCDAFMSKLSKRQLIYLVSVALDKSTKLKEHFQLNDYPNSTYIMANAMIHAGYQPFIDYCNAKNYISSGTYTYCHGEAKIEENAKEFIR